MKRALVTGGCGFIGSNLTKKLVSDGWMVDVVDNLSGGAIKSLEGLKKRVLPSSSFIAPYYASLRGRDGQANTSPEIQMDRSVETVLVIQDDLASEGMLKHIQEKNYDVIFHQAAVPRVSYSVEYPADTTLENVYKTIKLFESCTGSVNRVVWASSSSVYGGAELMPTPESERGKIVPKSPYAWQKFVVEDYAKMAAELYNLDIVCLRYFNVFGPGQMGDSPYSTAISAWCHAIKNNLPLRSDGDGTQTRDMCYVDNVVHANILAANADMKFNGRCYNIACGDSVSNQEILNYLKGQFDLTVKQAPERPGDVKHTLADISRSRDELGYEPLVRFWEGLNRTIEWWDLR